MKAISLFSGVGGFDLGFELAGIETVLQVERDPYALAVLARHWPNVRRLDDVHLVATHQHFDMFPPECKEGCEREPECIGTQELIDDFGDIDLIYGGDPCQENSNARRAADTISPALGGEFIRIVDAVRPRLVLRENPAAVRSDAPWPWFRFRAELERIGYNVLPFRLRACCVGADHRRERLFLLAELQDANIPRLEGDEREEMARALSRGQNTDATGPVRRRPASRVCGKPHGIPSRMDRLKGLGNAVDVGVATWIGRRLVAAYSQEATPHQSKGA